MGRTQVTALLCTNCWKRYVQFGDVWCKKCADDFDRRSEEDRL